MGEGGSGGGGGRREESERKRRERVGEGGGKGGCRSNQRPLFLKIFHILSIETKHVVS